MKSSARPLVAVVLIALIPRLIAAFALGNGFHFADEADYADIVHRLVTGAGFGADYNRVPGYPALLLLLALPAPDSVLWLRLAQGIVVALGAALTYLAADRLIGPAAAIPAALIYALDPLLVVASALLYPEATAALLMLGVVLLAWETVRRDSLLCAAEGGLFLGVLALFRPAALAVVPVVMGWILLAPSLRSSRRSMHAVVVGLACVLMLAPWTYRNYRIHGRLIPVSLAGTAGAVVWSSDSGPRTMLSRIAGEFGHFWELVPSRLLTDDSGKREQLRTRDPRLPTEATFSRGVRDLVSGASFGIELVLALAGAVIVWRTRRREAILLLAVVLVFALAHSLVIGKLRYRITILPLVFLFAGAACAALYGRLRPRATSTA